MADDYENRAELARMEILARMLESIGEKDDVREIRKVIDRKKARIEAEYQVTYSRFKGRTAEETENTIFNEVLARIGNDEEFVQFLFEELDGASKGNDYSKNFAKNCGIASRYYNGALDGNSVIDREDGPQQFLSLSIYTIFGEPQISVRNRINVVKRFIELGKQKGILSKYMS